jgi:hypothetical protein
MIVQEERNMNLFQIMLQQPIIPIQTINFLKGSLQLAHSGSIHMATFPLAIWQQPG